MSKFRVQTSAIVDKLKTRIKQQDQLIRSTQEMAEDVAVEYCSLRWLAKAKEIEITHVANVRLSNLKQSREQESVLRESLDLTKETYLDELVAAHAEIAELKEQINHQVSIISVLEEELEHTRKEIQVS